MSLTQYVRVGEWGSALVNGSFMAPSRSKCEDNLSTARRSKDAIRKPAMFVSAACRGASNFAREFFRAELDALLGGGGKADMQS